MTILQDTTYALRRLAKSPGLAIAAIVSIALGIAANATIFSMVSTFVLRPAPVGDPATLMAMHVTHHGECCNHLTYPELLDLQQQSKSFSGFAGYNELVPASISGQGEPERVFGQAATTNYFDVAQLPMALGRGFSTTEENSPVIVLGNTLWRHRFAADPAIVGKPITLSGHIYTVIGVAPPTFRGLDLVLDPQFWVPLGSMDALVPSLSAADRNSQIMHWLAVVGRLRPGITRAQGAAELTGLAQRRIKAHSETNYDTGYQFEPAGSLPPRDRATVLTFLGALLVVVLFLLCIACANVANLFFAQAKRRQREMSVRLALGAKRAQLIRQVLLESTLVSLAGGAVGVLLSLWATRALSTFHIPAPIPVNTSVSADWRVMLYAFLLSVGSGILLGIVPAWTASSPALATGLKGEDALARPGRRITLSNVLVIGQIAMSLVLLCATGLFLRSLQNASTIDIGFRSNGVLMMSLDPTLHGYSPERTVQFLDQARQRIARLPGVHSAVVTDIVPLSMGGRSDGLHVQGQAKGPDVGTELYMVTPGYFEAMGIPRVAGRDFANESATAPKVAVVNQTFVKKLFKNNESPIGQTVVGPGKETFQIVGVVKDTKSRSIGEDSRPILFRSLTQTVTDDPSSFGYTLLIRSDGNPGNLEAAVRHEIAQLDPNLAIFDVRTMQQHLRDALFLPRLAGTLFGIFGIVGLILAAVGLYGVISYSVTRRTREIGIRMALGAQIGNVQRLIVRQGMLLAGIAVVIGLPLALAVAKFSASFLYGIHPWDKPTFVAVPIFLATIALAACYLPARRASRVNPQIALRHE